MNFGLYKRINSGIIDFIRGNILEVNENNLSENWHKIKTWTLKRFLVYTTEKDSNNRYAIFANILPFVCMDILTVIILTAFPQIVLFLPSHFIG